MDLQAIYVTALARCAPAILVARHVNGDLPRNVVAIGKCAGAMLDGVANVHRVDNAFVAIPQGYKLPSTPAEVRIGGHPQMTPESFQAGRALLRFVDSHEDILFLISGGGSACVEVPLPHHSEQELIDANTHLIAAGLPIAQINAERKKLSAIKGGRLGERVRGRAVTLVYSDVSPGRLTDVASGPSERELILVADNNTLTSAAAAIIGANAVRLDRQLEADVSDAARLLADEARRLRSGNILVAGGEPTVVVKGDGRGGRCTELAVRFAALSECEALFGSSDGVDGNSGVAGIQLARRMTPGENHDWERALSVSDSFRIASQLGEPLMITATGNNLRDLYLVARD